MQCFKIVFLLSRKEDRAKQVFLNDLNSVFNKFQAYNIKLKEEDNVFGGEGFFRVEPHEGGKK